MKLSSLLVLIFLAGCIAALLVTRAGQGVLSISTEPGGAKIYINGTYRGTSPEQKRRSFVIRLADGEYTVTAVKEIKDSLQVKRATAKSVFVDKENCPALLLRLSRQDNPDIDYKNPAESGTFSDNGMVFTNSIGMKFVRIKGGCFQMGNTFGGGSSREKPVHKVCVDDFYLGAYEVTQKEYQEITGENPSEFKNGDSYPVENVSWDDAHKYIYKLSQRDGLHYSLPTEEQWEYAAREGGRRVRFGNGKDIADPAEINFDGRKKDEDSRVGVFRGGTTPVGSFSPNSLGLYDMSGNVGEWCQNRWYSYKDPPADDFIRINEDDSSGRIFRGGSWNDHPMWLHAESRDSNSLGYCEDCVGFRLLLPVHYAGKNSEDSLQRATKKGVFAGKGSRQSLRLRLFFRRRNPDMGDKSPAEPETFTNSIGMKFVRIKGGCFQMGDTFDDGDSGEKPVHRVCVDDFYLGAYEVTQKEYQKITGENPSEFKNGDSYPVENVNWDDIQKYIDKLSQRDELHYSLPSEAQWEYAAREGGRKVRFGNSKNVADPGEINFNGREFYKESYSRVGVSRRRTTPVGSFSPNSLGLYDMSGNVGEWCQDRWHSDYKGAPADGSAWVRGGYRGKHPIRMVRGGSWTDNSDRLRATHREQYWSGLRDRCIGFRLVLPVH